MQLSQRRRPEQEITVHLAATLQLHSKHHGQLTKHLEACSLLLGCQVGVGEVGILIHGHHLEALQLGAQPAYQTQIYRMDVVQT